MSKKKLDDDQLREFFEAYSELSTADLAALAGVSARTIRNWRNRIGLKVERPSFMQPYTPPKKKRTYGAVDPRVWKTHEWLFDHYVKQKLNMTEIANLVGSNRLAVRYQIVKFKIPIRNHQETMDLTLGKNKYCDEEWLVKHYYTREQYLEWCNQKNRQPDPHGGMELSLADLASIADVNHYTIINWMARFGLTTRELKNRCKAGKPKKSSGNTPSGN